MQQTESLRPRLGAWIESVPVQRAIIALILINAVILGLETVPAAMAAAGTALITADRLILSLFVIELLTKLFAQGGRFFRNPWNLFDAIVVGIALVPASGPLAVLRVLRVLRLVSMVPRLRFVVEALLRAIPGIIAIIGLLAIIYYVFAVIATGFFGANHPQWFGSIGASMYTLFQVMTLESWSMGIARPVMESHPLAWLFFVPFILVATFTILNLFIAIIVNTMQTLHEEDLRREQEIIEDVVHEEGASLHEDIRLLREEVRTLRVELARRAD